MKVKFRKFLVGANLANVSPTETLLQIFEGLQKSCNNEEDEETILDILETLVSLSPEYQNQNFATFLSEIENVTVLLLLVDLPNNRIIGKE